VFGFIQMEVITKCSKLTKNMEKVLDSDLPSVVVNSVRSIIPIGNIHVETFCTAGW
jgi:hypothetical protein